MEVELELYLKLNRTGLRQYVLEKESVVRDVSTLSAFWNALLVYKDDIDVVFYVTSVNPMMVLSCIRPSATRDNE
jgi:hypothetical protein